MSVKKAEKSGEMVAVMLLMKPGVLSVEPTVTALDVARMMKNKGVRNIFVAKEGKPIGVVRDVDLITKVVALRLDPATIRAEQVMLTPPPIIDSNARLADIAKLMSDTGVRRVLVVDKDKMIGTITAGDVLKLVSRVPQLSSNLPPE